MSGLAMFLKKNKIQKQNTKYAATKSLCGTDGKPLEWEIRAISTSENEKLREECTIEVPVTGKPNVFRPKVLSSKYIAKMIAASVVFPDLHDAELQDSYGVACPEDLIVEMVDDPVEYNDLATFIQQYSGLETTMKERIEEAKN
ncbi:MAG: hypothetical protein KH452_05915 [Clostridiales bacterium]|nr:hypothetical protein [Clostridiales bacterium]